MPTRKKLQSKTAIMALIQKAFALAQGSKQTCIPVDELSDAEKVHAISRRKFIEQSGKATLATILAGSVLLNESFVLPKNKNAEIVIVGGGIAGLSAAYYLKKAGYNPKIYEGSDRIGGRMFTSRNLMGENTWTEMGGEFIDTSHKQMWKFIKEFDLDFLDIFSKSETLLTGTAWFFNGQHYSEVDVIEAFQPLAVKIMQHQELLSDEIYYNSYNDHDLKFDRMSLAAYFDSIEAKGWIRELLEVGFIGEYGLETGDQSALNFLTVIGTETKHGFEMYGVSDERYKVKGGNQTIPEELGKRLQDHIFTDHYLEAIRLSAENKTELNFIQGNGAVKNVKADRVIITVPFTILRDVDIQANFPQNKIDCIKNISYGKNAKLFAGFNKRVWREQGYTGAFFTNNGLESGWENTQMQSGEKCGITFYTSGKLSEKIATGEPADIIKNMLPKFDEIYTGASLAYNNIAQRMYWPAYKYAKASYLCLAPGQYTTMSGLTFEPVGNIYFAGEHCSYEFQGFMNGAATTGRQAAEMVMKSL